MCFTALKAFAPKTVRFCRCSVTNFLRVLVVCFIKLIDFRTRGLKSHDFTSMSYYVNSLTSDRFQKIQEKDIDNLYFANYKTSGNLSSFLPGSDQCASVQWVWRSGFSEKCSISTTQNMGDDTSFLPMPLILFSLHGFWINYCTIFAFKGPEKY